MIKVFLASPPSRHSLCANTFISILAQSELIEYTRVNMNRQIANWNVNSWNSLSSFAKFLNTKET